jgi:glucose-6-phosphate dehydrogenase assembly protein OpcA
MSPQLTLQAPLELSPDEVPNYLERLWGTELESSTGASTFTLVVWEPSWLQQQLVRTGHLDGPISGLLNDQLFDAARAVTADCGLPPWTAPMAPELAWALGQQSGTHTAQDLRGQFVDQAISAHRPRRLITLAPTLRDDHPLETLVAAYCPLPEERSGSAAACGDVVVLRGGKGAIERGLGMVNPLVAEDLPCWVWWNGSLDESPALLESLALPSRRLVLDSSIGDPRRCLDVLVKRIATGQAVNDLNWLRLRSWTESLAMVFDPPGRRDALAHVVQLDLDVEGDHPVQGLLLSAWIADRLGWHLQSSYRIPGDGSQGSDGGIGAEFQRTDGQIVQFRLMSVPVGIPESHPGALVGLRLICCPEGRKPLCVILCSESGGCMRLEAGGVATMELAEEVVNLAHESEEMEMARLLAGGHDSTNPLLAAAVPLAAKLLPD